MADGKWNMSRFFDPNQYPGELSVKLGLNKQTTQGILLPLPPRGVPACYPTLLLAPVCPPPVNWRKLAIDAKRIPGHFQWRNPVVRSTTPSNG